MSTAISLKDIKNNVDTKNENQQKHPTKSAPAHFNGLCYEAFVKFLKEQYKSNYIQ